MTLTALVEIQRSFKTGSLLDSGTKDVSLPYQEPLDFLVENLSSSTSWERAKNFWGSNKQKDIIWIISSKIEFSILFKGAAYLTMKNLSELSISLHGKRELGELFFSLQKTSGSSQQNKQGTLVIYIFKWVKKTSGF